MVSGSSKTAAMTGPVFRRLPPLIRAARLAANMSQKALALSTGVDQSRLCALEKGRHVMTDLALEERLISALGCPERSRARIKQAGAHDRAMLALEAQSLDPWTLQIASAGLWAACLLSDEERAGLFRHLNEICRSKTMLDAVLASWQPADMEVVMT